MSDVFEDDGPDDFDPEVIAEAQQEAQETKTEEQKAKEQALHRLELAYKRLFAGKPLDEDVNIVLTDLAEFCNGHTTPHNHLQPNQLNLNIGVGRQQVYFRIMQFTQLRHDVIMNRFM